MVLQAAAMFKRCDFEVQRPSQTAPEAHSNEHGMTGCARYVPCITYADARS